MGCVEFLTAYILPKLQDAAGAAVSFLSSRTVERARNLIDLGKNADKLATETRRLGEIRDDLLRQVEIEERRPQMKRGRRVAGWLERVDKLEETVGAFRDSFGRRRTFTQTCSPSSLSSNYELGQTAVDLLGQVSELKNERDCLGGNLVFEEPPDAVVPVASSATTRIVGAERVLTPLRGYLLNDDAVGVVGIYGLGGAGKTTYMTKLNNEFLEEARGHFDVVIWVTVSQNAEISRLQEQIGVRLGFSRTGGNWAALNNDDRRDTLYQALSQKRFLLLLDDVWQELQLNEIGIPRPPENCRSKSKVVFTTRSKDVCNKMGAHQSINVGFLNVDDSWELFNLKLGSVPDLGGVGRSSSSSTLLPLAKTVVDRCGGLPLALITVARAMSGAQTVDEWEDAAAKLRESPEQVKDMEKNVLSVLKFSFNKLENNSMRYCLLYCCLFPEYYEIDTEELIEYCVGEGFLDTTNQSWGGGLDRARRKGRDVVRGLKAACLLESAGTSWDGSGECVKMHDVVRDMALWLTNGEEDIGRETSDYYLVVDRGSDEASGGRLSRRVDLWQRAKRISFLRGMLDRSSVELPSRVPNCPNLLTLLLRYRNIEMPLIVGSGGFLLEFMPALRVLDLSHTDIEELPEEIGLLVGLRHLNLQGTKIRSLPRELRNLVKLRQLDLSRTFELERIPREAILGLTALQTLNIFPSKYHVAAGDEGDGAGQLVTLSDMERSLEQLEELGIEIRNYAGSAGVEKLMGSNILSKCTRFLSLSGELSASVLAEALEKLNGLQLLTLLHISELEEVRFPRGDTQLQHLEVLNLGCLGWAGIIVPPPPCRPFPRLRKLMIRGCHGFEDLTWIQHLPNLVSVAVHCCEGLEVLLAGGDQLEAGGEVEGSLFPRLKGLDLDDLPRLRAISDRPLLLPSLDYIRIKGCPQLKGLPSIKGLTSIVGVRGGSVAQERENCFDPFLGDESETVIIHQSFLHSFSAAFSRKNPAVSVRRDCSNVYGIVGSAMTRLSPNAVPRC